MATQLSDIVITAGGSTVYGAISDFKAVISDLEVDIAGKAATSHTHSASDVIMSIVANDAALGSGSTDGELKVTVDSYDIHVYDSDNATWYDWRTQWMYIPASAMVPRSTNGPSAGSTEKPTNDVNFDYLAFDATTAEYADFSLVFPLNWNRGTIKAQFHWTSATGSTAADTCEWGLKGKFCRDNDAIDATWGTGQTISDALLANNGADHQITSATSAITLGGTGAAGCLVDLSVYRNVSGTDDMTEDAWLRGVTIQYDISGPTESVEL